MIKKMLAVSLILMFVFPFEVLAQASRYKLNTQYNPQQMVDSPSFRGSQGRGIDNVKPGAAGMPGGLEDAMGGAMGGAMGEAAMIGSGYQVHVLGEVTEPGTYKITASDRLSEVIKRAGGFAVNGSERNVELRRKGRGVVHVDLLKFKLFGSLDDNPYLTDNDVVFVPLRSSVVQVSGAVKRPDTYELKEERTLEDVINLAGGLNVAVAKKGSIKIIRFEEEGKVVHEVPVDDAAMRAFDVASGDVVVVPNMITKDTQFDYNVASIPGDQIFYPSYEDRVFVLGGVAAPGAYPFSPYYSISQYISLAGGITDRGAPKYKVVAIDGKVRKGQGAMRVNPGDTIMVKEHWMSPASWIAFVMGVASFGLSTTATVLALTKR